MKRPADLDLGHAFFYIFEDRLWIYKLAILSIIGLIPGLNVMAWGGYTLSIAYQHARGVRLPLPEWQTWSDIFTRGFVALTASLLYFLPLLFLLAIMGMAQWLNDSMNGVGIALQCCLGSVGIAYLIIAFLLVNLAHLRYVQTDQYRSYIEIGARLRDLQQMPFMIIGWVVLQTVITIAMIIAIVLSIITIIAPIIILSITAAIQGYILGEFVISLREQ